MGKMLSATTHVGSENSETTMEQYIFKRRSDGINIINLKKTWEKLMLAARAVAAIENPEDVFVVSSRAYGQRACLKFARYIGATAIAGRFTPGAFTNQIQAAFREPRLLVVTDPRADHQPVTESSYANIPIIAFCNVDSPTRFIDWANEPQPGIGGAPGPAAVAGGAPKYQVNEDWSAQQSVPQSSDWAAETAAPKGGGAAQWGGSSNWN